MKKEDKEIEEKVVNEKIVEKKYAAGIVVNCLVLNVRFAPDKNSTAISTLIKGSPVSIDEDESTTDFYKIESENGTAGFCMRSFIKIV